jgi:hypothetical protein
LPGVTANGKLSRASTTDQYTGANGRSNRNYFVTFFTMNKPITGFTTSEVKRRPLYVVRAKIGF